MKRPSQSAAAIFAVPLLIGLLSVVGLIAALTGDGLRNALSWVTLGVPVAAVIWAMRARKS